MAPAWPSLDSPMARVLNALRRSSSPTAARRPSGTPHFVHSLIRARLVDEYRLTVHPAALVDGISLMHGLPGPPRFEFISGTAYADGCIVQASCTHQRHPEHQYASPAGLCPA